MTRSEGVVAQSSNSGVKLSWAVPASTGDSPISDYAIESSTDGGKSWTRFPHAATTSTSIVVTGLNSLVPYVFRVAAINKAGTGSFSAPSQTVVSSGSVLTVPSGTNRAYGLGITLVSTVGAKFYYSTPKNYDGLPTNMLLYVSGVQVALVTVTTPYIGQPFVFERVVNGTVFTYTGRVASGKVDLKPVAPSVPDNLKAQADDSAVLLSWTAPASAGDSSITDYTIHFSRDGGASWSTFAHAVTTATLMKVTGLTNGVAYVFRVAAVNKAGNGEYSGISAPVRPYLVSGPITLPSLPPIPRW